MDCVKARKLIPVLTEEHLPLRDKEALELHLSLCSICREEAAQYEKTWSLLGSWKNADPAPGYISRFYTRLSMENPSHQRAKESFADLVLGREWIPVKIFAVALVMVFGVLFANKLWVTENDLAHINPEEIELVENIELAQYFDVIENIDELNEIEVIESVSDI